MLYLGVRVWLSPLSVQLLISAQVTHDLTVWGMEPWVGLCTDIVEPAWDSLSLPLSLSAPHPLVLSLSLKINKLLKKNVIFR